MHCSASRSRTRRSGLELADIFREHADRLPALSDQKARVVRDITACKTAALGGHLHECDTCGHLLVTYNSCRNRHCPKCQHLEQARWIEAQQADLLPIDYHHVVFTLPDVLHPIFLGHPKQAYALLFAAAAETLREVALRPRNLGAKIGFSVILHTWTQKLLFHPHLHCIVTGGGLDPDGTRWIAAKPRFLFSVKILATVFRGKLLEKLQRALRDGEICSVHRPVLRKAAQKKWVVYSKPPFGGPERVLAYLGRYTHRIAISNHRLVSLKQGQVTFRWKDRAAGNQTKLLRLEAGEFMRRFLLHVVPKGFMRIRHYGLLSNPLKGKLLPLCRELLSADAAAADQTPAKPAPETWQELLERLTGQDLTLCPRCRKGHLVLKQELAAYPSPVSSTARPP